MQQSDWQLKSTPALFIYAIDALKARRDGPWEDFHTKKKNIDNGNSQCKNVCFDSTCSVQFTRIQNLPGLVKLKMTKRAPSKIFQDILSLFWNSSRLILFFPFYTSPHSHQQTNIHLLRYLKLRRYLLATQR